MASPARLVVRLEAPGEASAAQALASLVQHLARHEDVTWVEARFPRRLHMRYAKELTFTALPEALAEQTSPRLTFPLGIYLSLFLVSG